MILHGGLRTTKDIDLLVDPVPENVERLKRALSILEDQAVRDGSWTGLSERASAGGPRTCSGDT